MNTIWVKKRMKDMHISSKDMSEKLGMDPSTYFRKMKHNGEDFNAIHLNVFKQELQMNEKEALNFLLP